MIASLLNPPAIVHSEGAGPAAEMVAERLGEERRKLQESLVLGQQAKGSINELYRLVHECGKPNWDGYNALPVSVRTAEVARQLLESLPFGTPAPSVGADPDGEITLEWHTEPRWTLSISISPTADLHYAALMGASKAYGTEPFYGAIPKAILQLVHRVVSA